MGIQHTAQRLLLNAALFVGGCSLFMSALVTNCCVSGPTLLVLPLMGSLFVIGISARLLLNGALGASAELRRKLMLIIVGVSAGSTILGAVPVYTGILPWFVAMVLGFIICAGATLWRLQLAREETALAEAIQQAEREGSGDADQEQSEGGQRRQEGDDVRPQYGRPEFEPERDWAQVNDALTWDAPPKTAEPAADVGDSDEITGRT